MKKVLLLSCCMFLPVLANAQNYGTYYPYPSDSHYYRREMPAGMIESIGKEKDSMQNAYLSAKVRYRTTDVEADFAEGNSPQKTDEQFGTSLALGIRSQISPGALRTELEININQEGKRYLQGTPATVGEVFNVTDHSLMANVYYDMFAKSSISPYIGAGIGITQISAKLRNGTIGGRSDDDYKIGYNVSAGLSFTLTDSLVADLGYRYLSAGTASFKVQDGGSPVKVKVSSQEIGLGLRYSF